MEPQAKKVHVEDVKGEDPTDQESQELSPIDWARVEKLRVTQKVIHALRDLDVRSVHLTPANRRKDARKKYLGYGTKRMLAEAAHTFMLDKKVGFIELLKKSREAHTKYVDGCIDLVADALNRDDMVATEDAFGLMQIAVAVRAGDQIVGVFRVGDFVSGKSDDLTVAKIAENVSYYGLPEKKVEKDIRSLGFFTSEKVAVVRNLLEILAQEVGSFLEEMLIEVDDSSESETCNYEGLITRNGVILDIIRQIKLIGKSESSVIIYGESGTGKELVSQLIHKNSTRTEKPFVTINCAALTETILEAELFGYKRGAFTGAIADKRGLFEVADKGTIFLDEVGEMSLSLQVKILRLIQEGTFMRVGDTELRKVDVRIIAATHRDLKRLIELGKFREDLYYRLAVVELTLPPLRDRVEDIPLLVHHFLEHFQKKTKKSDMTISGEAMKVFSEYFWPGNVREIRNEIERVVALRESHSIVKPKDLSKKFFYESYPEGVTAGDEEEEGFIKRLVDEFERNLLSKYLRKHKWNKTKVARLCGITRQGLNKKIAKYQLDRRKL